MSPTNSDPEEANLKAFFQRLKHQDEKKAPDFAHLLKRTQTAPRPRIRQRLLALAVTLVLLAAIFIAIRVYSAKETLPEGAAIISWRSPTDFLLRGPGEQFLSEIPELGKPLIQFNATFNSEDL
jgi:predicted PurR-regulated permease PerM